MAWDTSIATTIVGDVAVADDVREVDKSPHRRALYDETGHFHVPSGAAPQKEKTQGLPHAGAPWPGRPIRRKLRKGHARRRGTATGSQADTASTRNDLRRKRSERA